MNMKRAYEVVEDFYQTEAYSIFLHETGMNEASEHPMTSEQISQAYHARWLFDNELVMAEREGFK